MTDFIHMESAPDRDPIAEVSRTQYPWGLQITLCCDELEKLGLADETPGAGDELHFTAVAKVVRAEMDPSANGEDTQKSKRITLQITHMAVLEVEDEPEESREERAGTDDEDEE